MLGIVATIINKIKKSLIQTCLFKIVSTHNDQVQEIDLISNIYTLKLSLNLVFIDQIRDKLSKTVQS